MTTSSRPENTQHYKVQKPVILVVMDGVGISQLDHGNVVKHGHLPHLRKLMAEAPFRTLKAHGTAVGLPTDGDMGNSEVGHNALGSGQIYAQGARLVNEAIESGRIFQTETWHKLVETGKTHTLHFMGLLSDGNVHSHINQLKALVAQAKKDGVRQVALHALLDGRDVEAQSAHIYIKDMEDFFADLNDTDFFAYIASGGGRMQITMDRYEANWPMVAAGWEVHVHGEGPKFPSALAAIDHYRAENPAVSDQDLGSFVVTNPQIPQMGMQDGDGVLFFNFRGDRALEISRAFDAGDDFPGFNRGRRPDVFYAGMLEYDGDLHIPKHYLVNPPQIHNCLTEELIKHGLNEYAVSETQKFGHMTYFWNGNRLEPFSEELETWEEIPSDVLSFDLKPWMKAYEITEALIQAMASGQYDFIRANYPNGDMVGHTGNYQAALIAIETVDLCLGRLVEAVDRYGYTLVLLADHGNCEEMCQNDPAVEPCRPKTSHTLSPVPCVIYGREDVEMLEEGDYGLANVASTIAALLDIPPHAAWEAPIIRIK